MKFLLFAFVTLLVVASVSCSFFDDAFKVDDRRFVKPCRTLNQPCSSKRSMACCEGFNCEIPPLNKRGVCKTKPPACLPDGTPCTAETALTCCGQICFANTNQCFSFGPG